MSGISSFNTFKTLTKQKMFSMRRQWYHSEDIFTKMYAFTRAKTAKALGYYPYYPAIDDFGATDVSISGKKLIMLGSNNYLGLTNHPEVVEAGVSALRKYGSGVTGSRLLNGNLKMHEELENKIAELVGKEKALVFSTGYGVNLGVIASTMAKADLLFSDELNHASIVDGARFSRCEVIKYAHNDMIELDYELEKYPLRHGKLVISDGVFSMEGDIVNLPDLVKTAHKHNSRIMIDEAHSLGIFGDHGEGICGHYGLSSEVDLIMGTFSKSLGSIGGFIAAEEAVIDYLKHHARTMIFTAALPPVNAATVTKSIEILQREPDRGKRALENANYVRENLISEGFDTGNSRTPVIPIIIGSDMKTFRVWKDLMNRGVYTNPIISPAVPEGRSMLRTSYMATHTREQLDFSLSAIIKAGKKYHVIR